MDSMAATPRRSLGWRMVVRGTRKCSLIRMFPKPTIDKSSGIRSPWFRNTLAAPMATMIIGGLNGGGPWSFLQELQGRFLAFLCSGAGRKDEFIIKLNISLAQSSPVAFEPFLEAGAAEGPEKKAMRRCPKSKQVSWRAGRAR